MMMINKVKNQQVGFGKLYIHFMAMKSCLSGMLVVPVSGK